MILYTYVHVQNFHQVQERTKGRFFDKEGVCETEWPRSLIKLPFITSLHILVKPFYEAKSIKSIDILLHRWRPKIS